MRKPIHLSLVLCICALSLSATAQYPVSFQWGPATSSLQKEDQIVQNPCNVFATVAGMECWYDILYNQNNQTSQTIYLSQQPGYAWCGSGNLAPDPQSTNIPGTVQIMETDGTVTSDSGVNGGIKWGDLRVCNTDNPNGMNPYFGLNMGIHNGQIEPHSCVNPFNASTVYYIATSHQISLPSYYHSITTVQMLQREILNLGPIIINMSTPQTGPYALHCGNTHAYLIFGWQTINGVVTWLMRDSWPAVDPCGNDPNPVTTDSADLIAGINLGIFNVHDAEILTDTTISGKYEYPVYTSGTQQPTVVPVSVKASGNVFAISFTLPDHYLSGQWPLTATLQNLGQLDPGYTITWKSVPAHPGAVANVTFGSPNSASTTVMAGVEGYAEFEAVITLPNGIQQSVVTDSFYVCGGIPITIRQNWDFCSGSTRTVQWQMISRSKTPLPSNLQISWNLQPVNPEPSIYYQTSDFPNDNITLDWYDLTHPISYALRPTVVDPNYHNISDGDTQPGFESACASGGSITPGLQRGQGLSDSSFMEAATAIRIFPNPATDRVNVSLPAGKQYVIRVLNGYGSEILQRYATGSVSLELGGRARGVYFVEVIPAAVGEGVFVQQVILK
jgi:hypothetical protein